MTRDLELLESYARQGSQDAFATLVSRHLNLVYSAALRQVRSHELAQEVSQSVFTDLARNSGKLRPETILTAWLYQVTRRTAIDVVRRESRRQLREQIALEMNAMNAAAADWTSIEPLLDEAVSALDETDRTAVLLRFFEKRSLHEVGQLLGVSDDAAQKRVSRAVERLREFFTKRGITATAGGLAVAISANATQAAPIGLAATISTAVVVAGVAVHTSTAIVATKIIAMTTLQKTLVAVTVAVLAGAGIYEARKVTQRHQQIQPPPPQTANQFSSPSGTWVETTVTPALAPNERLRAVIGRAKPQESQSATPGPATNESQATMPSPVETGLKRDLPKDSWADVGFATPEQALKTRGWAVVNGSQERFKESLFITPAARKALEDMFIQMANASNDPNKAQYLQAILDNKFGVEEAILAPMMGLNEKNAFTGYRILSRESTSADKMTLEVETEVASGPSHKETLKFQRFGHDWKVVIDEDFVKKAR